MASEEQKGRGARPVLRPATLWVLVEGMDGVLVEDMPITIQRREEVRVWGMSAVERLHLAGGDTVILKYAVPELGDESYVLGHAKANGVPVPRVLNSVFQEDASMAMIMEDLGPEVREPTLNDAAKAAVAIHACPPLPGRPILDEAAMAALPTKALGWLIALGYDGRWSECDDISDKLNKLAQVARRRAQGAKIAPFGMCHSEFHPTSLHISEQGLRILDWARAYTGNGLLDLVSWQGTTKPLDLDAVNELLHAYVAAGGAESALLDRGGLPAEVWASGWFKLWIIEWFLENAFRRGNPAGDSVVQKAIRVHLDEAVRCLI